MKRKQMEVVKIESIIIKVSMEGLNKRLDATEEKNINNRKDRVKYFQSQIQLKQTKTENMKEMLQKHREQSERV